MGLPTVPITVIRQQDWRDYGKLRSFLRENKVDVMHVHWSLDMMVPGFAAHTTVALPLDCTYDFEVTAAKYLHALRDGALPLQFLFSGTIFVKSERGFSVQQVSWDCEDRYNMPVSAWRHLMAQHYPNSGWVRLNHDTVTALAHYKSSRGLLDLDHAVTELLAVASRQEVAR